MHKRKQLNNERQFSRRLAEDFDNCKNAQIKNLIEKYPNVLATSDKKMP